MTAQPDPRGDVAVLVPAAGAGTRLGQGGPKALRQLGGEPLLVHAVRRVLRAPAVAAVVVAAPPSVVDDVRRMLSPEVTVVAGGPVRQESVALALAVAPASCDIVLVHDAARALAPPDLFGRVAAAVRDGHPAVVPVVPVVDTVKEVSAAGMVVGTVDRSMLRSVQTPQGFRRSVLLSAHAAAVDPLTDDAGLVEKLGLPVHTVPGSPLAMKITTPLDLEIAELILRRDAACG